MRLPSRLRARASRNPDLTERRTNLQVRERSFRTCQEGICKQIKSRDQHLENRNNEGRIDQEHSARDNGNQWKKKVSEFFSEKLNLSSQGGEWRKTIPSLNLTANHILVDGQLVRFQGMIQVSIFKVR